MLLKSKHLIALVLSSASMVGCSQVLSKPDRSVAQSYRDHFRGDRGGPVFYEGVSKAQATSGLLARQCHAGYNVAPPEYRTNAFSTNSSLLDQAKSFAVDEAVAKCRMQEGVHSPVCRTSNLLPFEFKYSEAPSLPSYASATVREICSVVAKIQKPNFPDHDRSRGRDQGPRGQVFQGSFGAQEAGINISEYCGNTRVDGRTTGHRVNEEKMRQARDFAYEEALNNCKKEAAPYECERNQPSFSYSIKSLPNILSSNPPVRTVCEVQAEIRIPRRF
jgi:hypothetical protein